MHKHVTIQIKNSSIRVFTRIFFGLLLTSMLIELFTIGISQKIFYFTGYISFIYIAYCVYRNHRQAGIPGKVFTFIFAVFFIGLIRYAWYLYAKVDVSSFSIYDLNNLRNYQLSGKRFILSAFILYAGFLLSGFITDKMIKSGKVLIFISLAITLLFGVHEHFWVTHDRIKLTTDAASSSSYMILFIYATYLAVAKSRPDIENVRLDFIVSIITALLIVLSGTRISLLAYVVISVLYFICNENIRRHMKNTLFICSVLGLVSIFVIFSGARWIEGVENIQNYKTDSSTSLGARVAIWDSGLKYAGKHVFFNTPKERASYTQSYIKISYPENVEGYNNVKFNMHNDFLEVFSLQGVLGLISLLFIYIAFFKMVLSCRRLITATYSILVLFICGLTDAVLINDKTVMLFLISIVISVLTSNISVTRGGA